MIRVLLVDDHDLVRAGIKRLLEDIDDVTMVGEARSGEEALVIANDARPDVVLMDSNMPGMSGLEASKRLLNQLPNVKIIALTVHADEPVPSTFLQIGVHGYLTKGADVNEMVYAIRHTHGGRRYIAAEVAQKMALRQSNAYGEDNPFELLSERETQVMQMITQGQKVQLIAETLCLSPKTVNSYRYRLFDKLNVNCDVELTHLAIRYRVVLPVCQ